MRRNSHDDFKVPRIYKQSAQGSRQNLWITAGQMTFYDHHLFFISLYPNPSTPVVSESNEGHGFCI